MDSITGSVLHIGSALPNSDQLGCPNYVETNYLLRPCVKGYKKLTAENGSKPAIKTVSFNL